jgi:hypothetical protein
VDQTQAEEPDPRYRGWLRAPPFIAIASDYQDGGGALFWGLQYNGQASVIMQEAGGWLRWFKTGWSGPGQPSMIQMAATAIQNLGLQFWTINNTGEL